MVAVVLLWHRVSSVTVQPSSLASRMIPSNIVDTAGAAWMNLCSVTEFPGGWGGGMHSYFYQISLPNSGHLLTFRYLMKTKRWFLLFSSQKVNENLSLLGW